jgi:hypothetical protein
LLNASTMLVFENTGHVLEGKEGDGRPPVKLLEKADELERQLVPTIIVGAADVA